MNKRGAAFGRLPKLVQVSMIHSGALPDTDAAVEQLARKMEER